MVLTAAILAAHDTLLGEFSDALEEQSDETADRDKKQQIRVEAGNALYAQVVKYCNYGQRQYFATDEAKYNDYIVYNTPSGTPDPPPVPIP